MSALSLAPRPEPTPAFAKQLVDSFYLPLVAEALLRLDVRDSAAVLEDLAPAQQQAYMRDAAMVVALHDQAAVKAACYDAANTMVPGGLASLPVAQRSAAVLTFIRAFAVMRASLCGERPAQRAQYAALADADAKVPVFAESMPAEGWVM